MPGSELDAYDVAHVPMHPLIDQATRNITVSSFELAERERETHLLRKNLAKLKTRYAEVNRSYEVQREEVRVMKAKLSSGGLAASFANLDAKYQSLRRKHEAREETCRRATVEARHLGEEVATMRYAVQMKAEELHVEKDMLLEAARGGQLLQAREAAVAKLKQEFEAAVREAADLKAALMVSQETRSEQKAALAQMEERMGLLTHELECVGQSKEELFALYETLSTAHDKLTRNFKEMTARHDEAAGRVAESEHDRKDLKLYHQVLEAQLEQARKDAADASQELLALRARSEGRALERERDEAALHSAEVTGAYGEMRQRLEDVLAERKALQDAHDRLMAHTAQLERDAEGNVAWKAKIGELEASLRQAAGEAEDAREKAHALETQNAVLQRDVVERSKAERALDSKAATCKELEGRNAALQEAFEEQRHALYQSQAEVERLNLLLAARDEVTRQRSVSMGRAPSGPAPTPPTVLRGLHVHHPPAPGSDAAPHGEATTASLSLAGHLSDVPTLPSPPLTHTNPPPADAALVSSAFAMATNSPATASPGQRLQQSTFTISEVSPSPPSARKTTAAASGGGRKTITLCDLAYGSPGGDA